MKIKKFQVFNEYRKSKNVANVKVINARVIVNVIVIKQMIQKIWMKTKK